MRFEIVLAPQAAKQLRALPARLRSEVRDAMQAHLRHEPTRVGKSRIKRLRGIAKPQYRLRIGETRVFYDVRDETLKSSRSSRSGKREWLATQAYPTRTMAGEVKMTSRDISDSRVTRGRDYAPRAARRSANRFEARKLGRLRIENHQGSSNG